MIMNLIENLCAYTTTIITHGQKCSALQKTIDFLYSCILTQSTAYAYKSPLTDIIAISIFVFAVNVLFCQNTTTRFTTIHLQSLYAHTETQIHNSTQLKSVDCAFCVMSGVICMCCVLSWCAIAQINCQCNGRYWNRCPLSDTCRPPAGRTSSAWIVGCWNDSGGTWAIVRSPLELAVGSANVRLARGNL